MADLSGSTVVCDGLSYTLFARVRRGRVFSCRLLEADPELAAAIDHERERQQWQIELIASENIVSRAVLEAQGSVLTNKYAEGYPGRRYYGGCEFVDVAETLAIDRAKRLFGCAFANVQPHAGAQANQAVFLALLQPGDTDPRPVARRRRPPDAWRAGRTCPANGSTRSPMACAREDGRIDFDEVERQAETHRPRLIIAGGSAYPRIIDFARFRAIADRVGAYLMVDMAHFAGLVAGGALSEPAAARPRRHDDDAQDAARAARRYDPRATTQRSRRRINSAVFPGLQGGPLMHVIAAKAVAFGEALAAEFAAYARARRRRTRRRSPPPSQQAGWRSSRAAPTRI